jgi:[ribosomal protein S18]-alanine N-acetyltransferase
LIRTLEPRDVDAVLAVQSACPETAQWTEWDYARVVRGEMIGWVAQQDERAQMDGFLVARRIADQIEILNLAVRPERRRRGIGSELLRQSFAWGRSFGATSALLEVRETNLAALHFYERHAFEVVGRRRLYYAAPVEDALVLKAKLPSGGTEPPSCLPE